MKISDEKWQHYFFFFFSPISNCVVSSNTKLLHIFYFLLLHLLLCFLGRRRCSFRASFIFFLHIYFFFLSFFLSLSSFFISFVGFVVLFYGFICFCIGGFCLGLWRGGREAAGFLFMGCVFVRWLGCVSWVFKGWDRWAWVVGSGRRRSGTSGL